MMPSTLDAVVADHQRTDAMLSEDRHRVGHRGGRLDGDDRVTLLPQQALDVHGAPPIIGVSWPHRVTIGAALAAHDGQVARLRRSAGRVGIHPYPGTYVNRLADETSPYLRQHAHNPVHWQPSGDEAFADARDRDVPVLLSVGYSACHWCHVMAHESLEDDSVAEVVNDQFVCVKVDREERPDVDAVYMEATQAMTGSGGWPMTVFMTPDGEPFFSGTYFPRVPARGVPEFA